MAIIHIDAAASQNPAAAAGAAVFNEDGETRTFTTFLGEMDNHEAEWATLSFAVDKAVELNISNVIIQTDSRVISDSFDKNFVKNRTYKYYFDKVNSNINHFELFLINHIPRKQNKKADVLAKEALFKQKRK